MKPARKLTIPAALRNNFDLYSVFDVDTITLSLANNDPEKGQAALRHSYRWCHYIETFLNALNCSNNSHIIYQINL